MSVASVIPSQVATDVEVTGLHRGKHGVRAHIVDSCHCFGWRQPTALRALGEYAFSSNALTSVIIGEQRYEHWGVCFRT